MNKDFKYLPKDKRKKILLICDDIRVHSGVATVAKEIVLHTCQHFNWVQIAGAIKHPDAGKRFDLSQNTDNETGLTDSSVFLYPTDGYGNPDLVRQLIQIEKPDAIFIITDPRYFSWLFQMEGEIRKQIPIVYLNIWDDYPAPLYNKAFYESCDALLGISKQILLRVIDSVGLLQALPYVLLGHLALGQRLLNPTDEVSDGLLVPAGLQDADPHVRAIQRRE